MNPRQLVGIFFATLPTKKDCPKEQSFAYMGINITPEPYDAS